jgi:hypothetical protein
LTEACASGASNASDSYALCLRFSLCADRERKTGYNEQAFGLRTGSYLANYIALSYLNQYPLFSYKYSKVPVQLKLLRLSKSKLHKSEEGLLYLISLKETMNSYNASSHWEHINNNFPKK